MLTYGEFLYDGGSVASDDRVYRDHAGMRKLEALRFIMQIGYRAPFEFALSSNSFVEVQRARDSSYLHWAYDVLDHWNTCLAEAGPPATNPVLLANVESAAIGYLSAGDRALLRDAILFDCDTFLTMENKLPRNGAHLRSMLGLRVEPPCAVWERIAPWAALFH